MAIATQTGLGWDAPELGATNLVPEGGTTGQVLAKDSNLDRDASWQTPSLTAIPDGSIGSVKLVPLTTKTFLGRTSTGTGPVEAVPAATMRTDIGAQAVDADLTAIAGLASEANKLLYATGSATWQLADLTAFARSLLDDTDAAAMRATLGLTTGALILVTHTDAIPLDTAGFGKQATAIVTLTGNRTLTLGASPVEGGTYDVTFRQNSVAGHTISIPFGWIQRGTDSLGLLAGDTTRYVFEYSGTDVVFVRIPLTTVDVTAPTYGARSIAEGTPSVINVAISETIGATIPAVADITLTNAGGRTVTGVAAVGSTLNITCSSAFTWDVTPSIAIPTAKLSDVAGNLAGALPTSVVTNNRTHPVPNAPQTMVLGATGNTTQVITSWVAPATDSTHGPATLYQPKYRTPQGSGGYTNFGSPVSGLGPVTITGLVASTPYDIVLQASNATGAGGTNSAQQITTTGGPVVIQSTGIKNVVNTSNATDTVSFAAAVAAGRDVVFCMTSYNGSNLLPTGVVIAGTAATLMDSVQSSGSAPYYESIWLAHNVVGGSDIVITHGSSVTNYIAGCAEEWTGFIAGAPYDASVNANGVTGTATNLTTLAAKTVLYASCAEPTNFGASDSLAGPNTGYTQTALQNTTGTVGFAGGYKILTAAAAQSATFTASTAGVNVPTVLASFQTTP